MNKQIEHTLVFELRQPVSELFPLFSPEGEKCWVPGWDYENVMGTTELSQDYVFLTKMHDHRSTDAIWVVKEYDPASHFVQFYKIEPEDKLGVITVKCKERGSDQTSVKVTYKYIALSERGELFISEFTRTAYKDFIGEWRTLLSHYFESTH